MREYVRACSRSTDISVEMERKAGKRKEVSRCENGKRCSHCGINNKAENVRNNPRKKIFHVLAKQQQTNDKRVCR